MDDIIDDAINAGSFGKEIAKALVIGAASTVGVVGGLIVVGLIADKLKIGVKKNSSLTDPTH